MNEQRRKVVWAILIALSVVPSALPQCGEKPLARSQPCEFSISGTVSLAITPKLPRLQGPEVPWTGNDLKAPSWERGSSFHGTEGTMQVSEGGKQAAALSGHDVYEPQALVPRQ